ncbi:caspase family protein [Psychroserpens sp. MEBiC05023]
MKHIIVILILLFSIQDILAEKHALIIGIGKYQKDTKWSSLSSVKDIDLIKSVLLQQEFLESNILTLKNEEATYDGIKQALDSLYERVEPGDIVVIHYSGHGQQVKDINGDEIDKKDEAIVPYDARKTYTWKYKGERHLKDDELGMYINKFRNRLEDHGQLLLLMDSCYSGTLSRGGKYRGSQSVLAPEGWSADNNSKSAGSDLVENPKFDKVQLSNNHSPYVIISGSASNQLNKEYKGFGSLSFAFNEVMNGLKTDNTPLSYRQLFSRIESKMYSMVPNQTPVIEGNIDNLVFGNGQLKQQKYYPLVDIIHSKRIKIPAGKLQRLFNGTTVFIMPEGSQEVSEDKVLAKGYINNSQYNESEIILDTPLTSKNIKEYWVFIDEPTFEDLKVDIYIDKTVTDETIKDGLATFLVNNKRGKIVNDINNCDAVLSFKKNAYYVLSPDALEVVDKNKDYDGDNSLKEILSSIKTFSEGLYLKNLKMDDYKYEFEFKLIPASYNKESKTFTHLPVEDFINDNGTFQVAELKDIVLLEVQNKSHNDIYINILEIDSKGKHTVFLPGDSCRFQKKVSSDSKETVSSKEFLVKARATVNFKIHKCFWRFGKPYERIMLKAFATNNPIDFDQLQRKKRGPNNPMEKFFSSIFVKTRSGKSILRKNTIGYTDELIYEIVEAKE